MLQEPLTYTALCWIAFYAVVKNTPAWCERKWSKTTAIFSLESNRRSSFLTFVSVRFSVYTTQGKCCEGDDSLSRPKQRSIASAQNSIRNRRFVCEWKPDPMCFCCRHKSFPVSECRHSLALESTLFRVDWTLSRVVLSTRDRVDATNLYRWRLLVMGSWILLLLFTPTTGSSAFRKKAEILRYSAMSLIGCPMVLLMYPSKICSLIFRASV